VAPIESDEVVFPLATVVTDAGVKLHVTPDGKPLQVNDTVLLNEFRDPTVTVTGDVVGLPTTVVTDVGATAIEKSGADPTFSVYVVLRVWLLPVPVPVTVTTYAAAGALLKVVTVKVDVVVPGGVIEAGETAQVTVAVTGAMAHPKLIAALYPLTGETVIVEEVLLPAAVLAEAGLADRLKSVNVKLKPVLRLWELFVPVTVTAYNPVVALAVVIVSVAVAGVVAVGVTDPKLKLQSTLALLDEQVSVTAALNPPTELTVTVEVRLFPTIVEPDAGARLTVKLFTVSV